MKKGMIFSILLVIVVVLKITGGLDEVLYTGAPSDHFNGKKFYMSDKEDVSLWDFLKWRLSRTRGEWPEKIDPRPVPIPVERVTTDKIIVTLIGHSTFLIQINGFNILTDPVFSEKIGPFGLGGKRVVDPAVKLADLPKIDIILLSHNHYDHFDLPTMQYLNKTHKPLIIDGLAILKKYINDELHPCNCYKMDWWQEYSFQDKLKISFVPANHWSKRGVFDTNSTLWGGYVITTKAGKIYFTGDTGFGNGEIFRLIKKQFKDIKLALLPIGAYKPEWFMSANHTSPKDAVKIFDILDPNYAIAMHYNTFNLADDSYNEAVIELEKVLSINKISKDRFKILDFGVPFEIKK